MILVFRAWALFLWTQTIFFPLCFSELQKKTGDCDELFIMRPLSKSFHWSGVADVVSHPVSLIVSMATRYLTSQCVDSFFVKWLFMITDTAVVKFCSCGNLLKRALRLLFSHHWSQWADPLLKAYVASEINTQSEIMTGSQVGYNIEENQAPPLTIRCLFIPNTQKDAQIRTHMLAPATAQTLVNKMLLLIDQPA